MRLKYVAALGLFLAPSLAFAQQQMQSSEPSPQMQKLNRDYQAVLALTRSVADISIARSAAEQTLLESINDLIRRNMDLEKQIEILRRPPPPPPPATPAPAPRGD